MPDRRITWEMAKAALDKLNNAELWKKTRMDWDIRITHCFTEPVCPIATVYPTDFPDRVRYSHHADSIEEAVYLACTHAYKELIEGEVIGHAAPFTNPSDREHPDYVFPEAAHGK